MRIKPANLFSKIAKFGVDVVSTEMILDCAKISDTIFPLEHVEIVIENISDPKHGK